MECVTIVFEVGEFKNHVVCINNQALTSRKMALSNNRDVCLMFRRIQDPLKTMSFTKEKYLTYNLVSL